MDRWLSLLLPGVSCGRERQRGYTIHPGTWIHPGPGGLDVRRWTQLEPWPGLRRPRSRILAWRATALTVVIAAVDEKGNLQLLVGSGLKSPYGSLRAGLREPQ